VHTILKNLRLSYRVRLQFRAEAFNVFITSTSNWERRQRQQTKTNGTVQASVRLAARSIRASSGSG
jgi:hypothetical protein